ncbi:hypothetical protein ARSEF4850_009387 [Beauveria asiatica]
MHSEYRQSRLDASDALLYSDPHHEEPFDLSLSSPLSTSSSYLPDKLDSLVERTATRTGPFSSNTTNKTELGPFEYEFVNLDLSYGSDVSSPSFRNDANVSSMWMLQDDAEFRGAVDALQRVLKKEASSPADAFPHQEWSLFAGPATAAVSTPYCRAVLVASSNADPYWPSPAPFLDAGGNCNHLHDDAGLGLTAALGPRALDLSGLLGLAEKLGACLD